jgi:hypothetical protein
MTKPNRVASSTMMPVSAKTAKEKSTGYRGRNKGKNDKAKVGINSGGSVFAGNTDGMKGNVFQCHSETTNTQQFLRTLGVLEEHINKTFTYPQDVASVCKTYKAAVIKQPENLTPKEYNEDMGKRMIWETKMKNYIRRTDFL